MPVFDRDNVVPMGYQRITRKREGRAMQKKIGIYIFLVATLLWSVAMFFSFGRVPVNTIYWAALVLGVFISGLAFFAGVIHYRGYSVPEEGVRNGILLRVQEVLKNNMLMVAYYEGPEMESRLIKITDDQVFKKISVVFKEQGSACIARKRPAKRAQAIWMISESCDQYIIRTGSAMGRVMRALE